VRPDDIPDGDNDADRGPLLAYPELLLSISPCPSPAIPMLSLAARGIPMR